jgi:hypothetical protein
MEGDYLVDGDSHLVVDEGISAWIGSITAVVIHDCVAVRKLV